MTPRAVGLLWASMAVVLAVSNVAYAGDEPRPGTARTDRDKLDSGLQLLADAAADGDPVTAETGESKGAATLVSGFRIDADERVLVDVYLDGSHGTVRPALEALGMEVVATSDRAPQRLVEGWLPADALDDATALAGVRALRGVPAVTRDQGSVLSEGDAAHRGPEARALGATGAGVKVGIVSDSIDQVGGGVAASQATGDLPASVTVLQDDATDVVDEGRAMAEVVYDTAPGVTAIYFATGTLGAVSKAGNIAALVAQGVSVIADDVFYIDEPFFQDGVVAQAVDQAEAAGVTYLASAGNRARQSWEGTYSGLPAHDFDPGVAVDTVQTIGTFTDRVPFISLQWAEPWGSATTDLAVDVYLDDVLSFTVDTDNLASGIPAELASIDLTGITRTVGIAVRRVAGSGAPFVKYIVGGVPAFGIAEHPTDSPAINPDAASARGALAVGASRWTSPTFPEVFSSRGPAVTRRFDALGAPLVPFDVRPKPELAAADGVATTVPGFQPFFGTSAAAPSAAAVAALVRSARPSLTVEQVASILTNPANALDCVATAGQPDLDCGAGFLLADKAVAQALDATPPTIRAVTDPVAPGGRAGWFTSPVVVSWSVTDSASPIMGSTGCGGVAVRRNGVHTRVCSATSWGGSSTGSVPVKVDKSRPFILGLRGIKRHYAGGEVPVRSELRCRAKDPVSGIARCRVKGFRTTAGTHTLRVLAVNGAGLRTRATFTYTIT